MKPEDIRTGITEVLSGDIVCGIVRSGIFSAVRGELAPVFLQRGGAPEAWLRSRAIPASRGLTARNLHLASGLASNADPLETALAAHGACMTDNYWIRRQGDDLSYEEIRLDHYDGFFYRLALGLDSDPSRYRSDRLNPELASLGNSDKAWMIGEDGTRWLYKRQPLVECWHEILASEIAYAFGIDTVRYELIAASEPDPELGRVGIVRTKDFTQHRDVNLEHADGLLQGTGIAENDIAATAELFAGFGLAQEYLNLRYFDILVGNPDRHRLNYGVLRSRTTGQILGMAPNYDNNFAFLSELDPTTFRLAAIRHGWKPPEAADGKFCGRKALREGMDGIPAFANYDTERLLTQVEERMQILR